MAASYGSIVEPDGKTLPPTESKFSNVLYDEDEFDYLDMPEIEDENESENRVSSITEGKIPFGRIFGPTAPFDSPNRLSFLPGHKVSVEITNVETDATHLLNPHLYHIEVTHGNFKWRLRRRFKEFQNLHNELLLFRAKSAVLPPITKEARERRKSFAAINPKTSKFPKTPDTLVRSSAHVQERKVLLEDYLQSVLRCPAYRSHPQMLLFLDVSSLSFVSDLGPKQREGMVKKKSGGRRFAISCCLCDTAWCPGRWLKRWLVLKDTFMVYLRPEDGRISDVLLMDQDFMVNFGLVNTGWRNGLKITNLSRHLFLKCPTQRKASEWYEDVMKAVKGPGQDYIGTNRYRSFVPVRPNSYCNWFVDGASYMAAVADALETAKEEIFITDWMLSPELYLKRPMLEGDKWRLDMILKRKADAGVKVFILVYKELEMALGINSNYAKHALLSKHPENIRVQRHPDGIKLWSHHEKCVVIDQRVAFLGGIDLCYGRWDTRKHRLTDFGSIHLPDIYGHEDKDALASVVENLPEMDIIHSLGIDLPSNESTSVNLSINKLEKQDSQGFNEQTSNIPKASQNNDAEDDTMQASSSATKTPDQVPSTFDAFLKKTEEQLSDDFVFSSPEHADVSRMTSSPNNNNIIPKKEDEEELEEAFKAFIEQSSDSPLKMRQKILLHKYLSGDAKRSLPFRIKKLFERKSKSGSDDEEHSDDGKVWENKFTKFDAVEENVKPGTSSDRKDLDHNLHPPGTTSESDSQANIVKPNTPQKTTRKLKLKSLADFKILFHRHHSQTVDVTDDALNRSWDEKMFKVKELDDPDRKLDQQLPPEGTEGSLKIWVGKDYVNFIFKDFVELDKPFTDMIDRRQMPRMPWHDMGAVVFGKAARDVARHFIQRWNFTKLQKAKANVKMPFLLPRSNCHVSIPKWLVRNAFCCNCQILRSASEWSAGIKFTENSIHNAYTDLILTSKHYIYIENQFFISIASDRTVVNHIAGVLYERIVEAHRSQKNFRVYVVLPLLPAFEGQLGTSSGTSIQAVIHWNYASICRGNGNSLLERLVKVVPDPFKYISFYGLRKHEEMLGKLTTELVYVHSKLMIIDDRSVIIGSANINDRSMLGSRDSELALIVQDTHFVDSVMDGQPYKAGAYACSLRKSLFREHLGVTSDNDCIDVTDPVADEFYKNVWLRQASINTSIFSKVFNCIPTDEVLTLEELRSFQKRPSIAEQNSEMGKQLLMKVKGHLVLMPLLFLSKEYLAPTAGCREALAPTVVWT